MAVNLNSLVNENILPADELLARLENDAQSIARGIEAMKLQYQRFKQQKDSTGMQNLQFAADRENAQLELLKKQIAQVRARAGRQQKTKTRRVQKPPSP